MYCFCKQKVTKGFFDGKGIVRPKFPDNKDYCSDWIYMYLARYAYSLVLPFLIAAINSGSKMVLRVIATKEKRHTISEWKQAAVTN